MADRWKVEFDFDCQGDAPKVFLVLDGMTGGFSVEAHEEPLLKSGGDPENDVDWSWEAADWKVGPKTEHLLAVLNAAEWPHPG